MGFDFAPQMIEKGKRLFPHLDLRFIQEAKDLTDQVKQFDIAILSTVLCCNPEQEQQEEIISAIKKVLKAGGILYICDFLITRSELYLTKYQTHAQIEEKEFGKYCTSEGVWVRYHSTEWLLERLKSFDLLWLKQIDDVTMNGNLVRTVHLIAQNIT